MIDENFEYKIKAIAEPNERWCDSVSEPELFIVSDQGRVFSKRSNHIL